MIFHILQIVTISVHWQLTFRSYYGTFRPQFGSLKVLRPGADDPFAPPCCLTDCQAYWPHANLGFGIAAVEAFFSGGQITDWSFQCSRRKYVLRNGSQRCLVISFKFISSISQSHTHHVCLVMVRNWRSSFRSVEMNILQWCGQVIFVESESQALRVRVESKSSKILSSHDLIKSSPSRDTNCRVIGLQVRVYVDSNESLHFSYAYFWYKMAINLLSNGAQPATKQW